MNASHAGKSIEVFIALGSNQQRPVQQVQQAFTAIAQLPDTQLCVHSSLYRTAPVGYTSQPDFINAVAKLRTQLLPYDLLQHLLALERVRGRIRLPNQRGHARPLDLDILLYGDLQLTEGSLTLPHPRMCERAFVLYPLAEIAPDLVLPSGQSLQNLLTICPPDGIMRLKVANATLPV